MKSRKYFHKILLSIIMMHIFVLNQKAYADVVSPGFLLIGGAFVLILLGLCIGVIVLSAVLIIRHIKKKNDDSNKPS